MPRYSIEINDDRHELEAAPETPLLWILRDTLGLTGTKYGCGLGQCGACTIHLDGAAARACMTPVASVRSRAVTTIEGLARARRWRRLFEAWIAEDVPECGYCQPGQIMSAAALLARRAQPSPADIDRSKVAKGSVI